MLLLVLALGNFTVSSGLFWTHYSFGAAPPMFTDTECFINALSNEWMGKAENRLSINPGSFYKPNIWVQREYAARRSTGHWHWTVALGKASYRSPCITDCTEFLHTVICIIWRVLSHMPLKVDTDECIQIGHRLKESGCQAGSVYSVIQPPTTAPLCSAATMATPPVQTHTQSMLFWPSSLPLCEETANIEATQEVFHPRYLHAPLLNQHHVARLWPAATLPSFLAESFCAYVGPEPTLPPPSTLAVVEDAQRISV